ncbi:MAG: rhomboid family intramembrane serine protease [bacterium]|nr:rhomboid family intramembrane serine protease [bacterium]
MVFPGTRFDLAAARLPWLCGAVIAVSFVVMLAMPTRPPQQTPSPEAALAEAFAYWQTHGHLDAPASVTAFAKTRFDDRRRPIALAAIRELGRRAMPEDERARQAQRTRLDDLAAVAALDPSSRNPLPRDHPLRRFGFAPADPGLLSLVIHPFLYASWAHFLCVCSLLLLLGTSTELRWGPRVFAGFLLASTLGAAAVHTGLEPTSNMSLLGASGSVSALMAVHLLRHRLDRLHIEVPMPRRGAIGWHAIDLPGPVLPGVWLIANLALAVWLHEAGVRNDLSLSALVGGFAVGAIAFVALRQLGLETPYLGVELEAQVRPDQARSRIDEAYVARDMGDVDRAFELFRGEARARPEDLERTRSFWAVAVSTGQSEAAAPNMSGQIQRQIRAGQLATAATLWREFAEQLPDYRLPAADVLRLVPALLDDHPVEFALAALRQCVDAPRGELSIGLALQILDTAEQLDPFTALMAARRALALPELHAAKRERILARVRELDPEGPEARAHQPAAPPPTPMSRSEAQPVQADALELPSEWEIEEPELELDRSEPAIPGNPELTLPPTAAMAPPDIAIRDLASKQDTPVDLAALPRFDGIQAVAAVATELRPDVLYFRLANGRKAKVAYRDVEAMAVAALRDIASKPVVVIDLLLNWRELGDTPLRTIRLRSDQFDPARLVESVGSPTENLQAFLSQLLERTDALPLPDAQAVIGQPFRVFKFMRSYQRRVLKVDC